MSAPDARPVPSSRRRKATLGLVALLLTGIAGLGWQAWPPHQTAGGPAGPSPAGAPATPRDAGGLPPALAATSAPAAASASAGPAAAGRRPVSEGIEPALLATIEKQWCTHYAEADAQSRNAVEQGHPVDAANGDLASLDRRIAALRGMPTEQAREAVRGRVLARWIDRLDQAGDARSAAVAAYLSQRSHHEGWDAREARLAAAQRQALQTTDPTVAALWASGEMNCVGQADCKAQAMQRWRAVEPGNLMAWLPGPLDKAMPDAQWQALGQARYARSHSVAVQARLLELLPLAEPGLEREEALAVIEGAPMSWRMDSLRLLNTCRAAGEAPSRRTACLVAADLLWNDPQPSLLGRIQALALADKLGADGEAVWADRAAALKQMFTPAVARSMPAVEFGQDLRDLHGCSAHAPREQRLRALVDGGPLKVLEQAVARGGASRS